MPVRSVLIALLALLALAGPARAADAPVEIALAHTQPQDPGADPAAAMAWEFKHRVEEASHGSIKVNIFPEGQLGGNREMAKLVSRNIIQTALVTVGGVAPLYPPLAVLNMPFVLENAKIAYQVFDGPFGRHLAQDTEAHSGLAVLGFGETGGFYVITNSKRPIRSAKDMAGLKIRTIPGAEPLEAMIRSVGASPVKVSSREEFTALASGVIDGQMNPPAVLLGRHYDEVQRYVTLTNHVILPYVWIFNQPTLAALTPEQQKVIRDAAPLAIAAGRLVARIVEGSDHGLPALHRRMEVVALGPGAREDMKTMTQPKVREALIKSLGDEGGKLVDEFQAAAKAATR